MATATAAMLLSAACAFAQGAVITGGSDPLNMLALHAAPDAGAAALGKFLCGTPVEIVADAGGGWSQIAIGTGSGVISGYAMTQYLGTSAGEDATYSAVVASPYGTPSVVLRDRASNSYGAVAMLTVGDRVQVIGEMGEFRFVRTGSGCVGCLLASELR